MEMLSLDKVFDAQVVLKRILRIEMETRDFDHVNLITRSLMAEGFKLV